MQARDQASSSSSKGRAVLRGSAAVAALIGLGLLSTRIGPEHSIGASIADEFAVSVVQQEGVPMVRTGSATLPFGPSADEVALPPRYQGEPATF